MHLGKVRTYGPPSRHRLVESGPADIFGFYVVECYHKSAYDEWTVDRTLTLGTSCRFVRENEPSAPIKRRRYCNIVEDERNCPYLSASSSPVSTCLYFLRQIR